MSFTFGQTLASNIVNNFNYLKSDYTGAFQITSIQNILINSLISLFFIFIFFHFGAKIKKIFFKNVNLFKNEPFIEIALGYIALGTGVASLGFFSLLYKPLLILFISIAILISLFPFSEFRNENQKIINFFKSLIRDIRSNKWIYTWIMLFIFIGFLKLQSPEMREDQYHTDLPVQYLKNHSIMIPSKEQIMVSASPQLSEMSYLIAIFLGSKEATRYIHFIFYILVLLLLYSLSKDKKY